MPVRGPRCCGWAAVVWRSGSDEELSREFAKSNEGPQKQGQHQRCLEDDRREQRSLTQPASSLERLLVAVNQAQRKSFALVHGTPPTQDPAGRAGPEQRSAKSGAVRSSRESLLGIDTGSGRWFPASGTRLNRQ